MNRFLRRLGALALCAGLSMVSAVRAQPADFPNKPLRIVVTFRPAAVPMPWCA